MNPLNVPGRLMHVLRKVLVLRKHDLLDERVPVSDLDTYLYTCNVIGRHQGFLSSLQQRMCVTKGGAPLPWYTYPAIEQLSKWDFTACAVFEYGCGNSSRWWAERAESVISVESSRDWYDKILSEKVLPPRVAPVFVPFSEDDPESVKSYCNAIDAYGQFNVIVVDGEIGAAARLQCTKAAIPHLKPGGILILDNSDWHPRSCQLLRENGLLQVDYCGLGPLNTHAETTSVFFSPPFTIRPLKSEHPGYCIGGLSTLCD